MKLVIAEKPSVAREYAKILGATSSKDGYIAGNGYLVSWCIGHLIEQLSPEEYDERYKKWNIEDLPIIPDFRYKVIESVRKQYKIVSELLRRADVSEIICGTDAGREGELIFRLVYNYAKCKKPVQRLWVSSMTEESLRNGFNSLKPSVQFDSMYKAGSLRSKADWLIGMNMSRLFSILHNSSYSIGRVQTPTLRFIIDRDVAIDSFVESKSYGIGIDTKRLSAEMLDEDDKLLYLESKKAADSLASQLSGKAVTVESVKESKKSEERPLLFSLTSLQQAGVQKYGYTAKKVLELAQSLYMSKLITYPRTESNYLTEDMRATLVPLAIKLEGYACDCSESIILKMIERVKLCGAVIDSRQINNAKVSDHHAIIPTGEQAKELLPLDQKNIYGLVCQRFLLSLLKKHEYIEKDIILATAEKERFRNRCKQITEQGFKEFLKDENAESLASVNDINKGESLEIASAEVTEKVTQPPKRFNDSTMLGQMENVARSIDNEELKSYVKARGLGTPATRASIIERLIKQGFICREKSSLRGTELGRQLISSLPEKLTSPTLTAEWEEKLQRIEGGEDIASNFYSELTSYVQEIVSESKQGYEGNKSVCRIDTSKKPFAICPKCKESMYETFKAYTCNDCGFALFKGKENAYFAKLGISLTTAIAKELLAKGSTNVSGIVSSKTGKKYSATIRLQADGKYAGFKMEF